MYSLSLLALLSLRDTSQISLLLPLASRSVTGLSLESGPWNLGLQLPLPFTSLTQMWINQQVLGEVHPTHWLYYQLCSLSRRTGCLQSNHACRGTAESMAPFIRLPMLLRSPSPQRYMTGYPHRKLSVEIHGIGGGEWKTSFFLRICGKQILQFSSLMMPNIAK